MFQWFRRIRNNSSEGYCGLLRFRCRIQAVYPVHRYSESFPEREKYGLAHRLRRAAVSIPANIAEGLGKRNPAEKARFLNIAEGLRQLNFLSIIFYFMAL